MQNEQTLLVEIYRSFNLRDIDAVLNAMHKDVDWPNGMEGGRVRGHREVRDYWTRQWTVVDPHVEPVSFATEPDGRTAIQVNQTIRDLSGKVLLERMVEHVYLIEDGLIRSMEIREDEPR